LISEYKKQEVGDTVNCGPKKLLNTHIFNVWWLLQFITFYTQRTGSKIWCISSWDYIFKEFNWDMNLNTVIFQKQSDVQILCYFILCHL